MSAIRMVPFSTALRKGADVARWHRKRHPAPDLEAWEKDWREFQNRTAEFYSRRDLELIRAHAMALLAYDGRTAAPVAGLWAPDRVQRFNNLGSGDNRPRPAVGVSNGELFGPGGDGPAN